MGYTGRVVLLDLAVKGSKVSCQVERIRPGPPGHVAEKLFVSWNARKCPTGYEELGGGVACVQRPAASYARERFLDAGTDDVATTDDEKQRGVKRFSFGEPEERDVLMFALLPPSYKLMDCSVDAANPSPFVTKVVKKRLVLIFALPGSHARITCAIEPAGTANVGACSADLNRELGLRNTPVRPIDGVEVRAEPHIVRSATLPQRANGFSILAAIYYPLLFVFIVAVLAAVFRYTPWYAAPVIVVGGILVYAVVGAFVIRQREPLPNESFVKLMGVALKALPVIGKLIKI